MSTAAWRGTPWGPVDDPGEIASIHADEQMTSRCGLCGHTGHLSTDQIKSQGGRPGYAALKGYRFYCDSGHVWIVTNRDWHDHDAFLTRAGLK